MFYSRAALTALCLFLNSGVFAIQAMDDSSLGQVSGQDGITITINAQHVVANKVIWTDNDGLQPFDNQNFSITSPQKGSVILGDGTIGNQFKISGGTSQIKLDTDAGSTGPFLNISVVLPDNLTIETGKIYVAGRDSNNQFINQVQIADSMTISLGKLDMNLQLGSAPQGSLLKIYGKVDTGIRISNVHLYSSFSQNQGIGFDQMLITDAGGADLHFNGASVSVLPTGLKISPSVGKYVDVSASSMRIGDLSNSPVIGDMTISNLKLDGTSLTIAGH